MLMWFEYDYYPTADVLEELNKIDSLHFKTLDDLFNFASRKLLTLSICVSSAHVITVNDFCKREDLRRELWELRGKEYIEDDELREASSLKEVELEKKIIEIGCRYKDTGKKIEKVWLENISRVEYKSGRLIFIFDDVDHYLVKPFISGKKVNEYATEHFLYRDFVRNPLKNTRDFIYTAEDSDAIVFTLEEKDRVIALVSESKQKYPKANQQRQNLVYWNEKKVKPATKERYEIWQLAVNEMHEANSYLSHDAICTRIASKFKVSPNTIRKVTTLPHS